MTEITDTDRDAATVWEKYLVLDSPNIAQAFACHREASTADLRDEVERLRARIKTLEEAVFSLGYSLEMSSWDRRAMADKALGGQHD